jgi:hypothetical protein
MLTVTASASTALPDEAVGTPNKWLIIGLSVGGIFLLMFMTFLYFFYRSVRNSTQALMSSVQNDGRKSSFGYSYNPKHPEFKASLYIDPPRSPTAKSPLMGHGGLSPVPKSATKSFFSDADNHLSSTVPLDVVSADNEYLVIIAFGELSLVSTCTLLTNPAFSEPELDDEVELVPGDIMLVHKVFDDGWAAGENTKTGQIGIFPLPCCVQVNDAADVDMRSLKKKTDFRKRVSSQRYRR